MFQLCQATSSTQSHVDFCGHDALICLLRGRKLIALTAPRKDQLSRLEYWWAKDEYDPACWWSEYGMDWDTPVFCVELKAGEALWIPSGWVHFVISFEECHQVGINFIPQEVLPHAITHWRHEREMVHRRIPCVLPCNCNRQTALPISLQPSRSICVAGLLSRLMLLKRSTSSWYKKARVGPSDTTVNSVIRWKSCFLGSLSKLLNYTCLSLSRRPSDFVASFALNIFCYNQLSISFKHCILS